MPQKEQESPARGLWERVPGSGIWWVRYRDHDGKLHREKSDVRVMRLIF